MKTAQEILNDLEQILRNFQGREYSGDISAETSFFGDLGFASIDAVVLGETLQEKYGVTFPFHELLAELSRQGAQDLSLGEIAGYLHQYLEAVEKG